MLAKKARDRVSCRRQGIRRAVIRKAACAGWEDWERLAVAAEGGGQAARNDGVCVTQYICVTTKQGGSSPGPAQDSSPVKVKLTANDGVDGDSQVGGQYG